MPLFIQGNAKVKLLILYFLRCVEIDATSDQVYKALYSLGLTSYFDYCDAMAEIKQESYIAEVPRAFGQSCKLTIQGKQALDLFEDSIPLSERESIKQYSLDHVVQMQQETQLTSTMEQCDAGGYLVHLVAAEGTRTILEIMMQVASREMAIEMRKNWAQESCNIYDDLYAHLLK